MEIAKALHLPLPGHLRTTTETIPEEHNATIWSRVSKISASPEENESAGNKKSEVTNKKAMSTKANDNIKGTLWFRTSNNQTLKNYRKIR